jgi:glycosyltransferase involved in cell wall biosynthesis
MRLAILTTHPVQYYAPVFRHLAMRPEIELRVFYGWKGAMESVLDPGFGRVFAWDVPLVDGYDHVFLENRAADPGSHHHRGIDCPLVLEHIKQWRPDTLIVYGWNFRSHLKALNYFHGRIPVFFRGDSTLLDEYPGWRKIARRLWLRNIYRRVDVALAVGSANRAYFLAHGLKSSSIRIAPHSIDNSFFADTDGSYAMQAASWRQRLKIPEGSPVILFAGKLESKKAPDLLLEAFCRLNHPNAHLLFGGAGPLEFSLKQKAHSQIHFVGFQNQSMMPVFYRMGDVLVLPSRGPGETWGLAINEAMACGRAIIASDKVGASQDLIQPGRNGYIFPSENRTALMAALRHVLANREDLKTMGLQSLEIIQDWSIEKQVDSIIDALNE